MKETGCYIHIPFCDHKCIYCDFYSVIDEKYSSEYLTALKKEIIFHSTRLSNKKKFKTIYFGGGTPSLLNSEYLEAIINTLQKNFIFYDHPEITIEMNPGTVNRKKLEELKQIGINRISVGIQSFDNNDLKFLTRIHNSETAINTVENAYDAGFENISIDLIFNIPGQNKTSWLNNLKTAILLPIKHISAYSLILERGTILNKMVLDNKLKIAGEDHDAELYETTIDFLISNDFIQYEVSNFSKTGFQCVHNNLYWTHKEYLGFGCSAHSFINSIRWWNYSNISRYFESIHTFGHSIKNREYLSDNELMEEYLLLHLRGKGISKNKFINRFGTEFWDKKIPYISSLFENNYLVEENGLIKMTKKGYLLCDEILTGLIS